MYTVFINFIIKINKTYAVSSGEIYNPFFTLKVERVTATLPTTKMRNIIRNLFFSIKRYNSFMFMVNL
jgi:hypothetical protein